MLNTLKKWLPIPTLAISVQFVPLLVMFAVMWITAFRLFELGLSSFKFWEYLVYGWMYAAVGYWVGLGLIIKFLRLRWLAVFFAGFYLLLYAVNIAFLHHGGIVLQPYYLSIVSWTNWTSYLTPQVWILVGVFALNGALAAWLICRHAGALAQLHMRGPVLLLVLLWAAPHLREMGLLRPSKVIVAVVNTQEAGMWRVDQTDSLRMIARNPVEIFVRAIVKRPRAMPVRPTSDLAAASPTLKAWGLPLGPRQYPSLGLKPFKHVVVFATESLSLDFMSPYNGRLPLELTPFYGSDATREKMFVNYRCVAFPTQPGLTAMYNSHPNALGLLSSDFKPSMIKQLNSHGFESYYVMSAPETFLNNITIFTRMGFQHVLGTTAWLKDPEKAPFVEGRGLMDRILFDAVLDLLEQNRDKKVFIHVINIDTHSPDPREYYGTLQYPSTPPDIERLTTHPDTRKVLAGIFRHDHDVGRAIRKMQERNLLTEDTLVVLTADHNYPPGETVRAIPGYPHSDYTRLPLVFLSGQTLPRADLENPHSQLDFAPTIMHLLDLPVPAGWWGESIFDPDRSAPYVARLHDNLIVDSKVRQATISLDRPNGAEEKGLVDLFHSVYADALPEPMSLEKTVTNSSGHDDR